MFCDTFHWILISAFCSLQYRRAPLYRHRLCTGCIAHRGSRGIALLFLDHVTRRGWGDSVMPWPLFTPGKNQYALYRRLGGTQGRSGQVWKILPPPVFDPWTVQPVASCNTDWATRPTGYNIECKKMHSRNTIKLLQTNVWKFVFLSLIERLHSTIPSLYNILQLTIHLHVLNSVKCWGLILYQVTIHDCSKCPLESEHMRTQTVTNLEKSQSGCKRFERHQQCIGEMPLHFQLQLNTTGVLSGTTEKKFKA